MDISEPVIIATNACFRTLLGGRSQGNRATGLHFTGVNRKTELKLCRPGVNDG
jgi:hypothetical protein